MKKTAYFILFMLVAGCTNVKRSSINPDYKVEVVEAKGTAPIIDNNLKAAKEASISDALKNALHLVIGVYVSGQSLVAKSVLIDDEITSKTEGYIEKYEVLKEYVEDNFYKTKIKAYVRKEDITGKLKKIENEVEKIGSPGIYSRVIDNNSVVINFAQDYLISELRKDRFRVIDDMKEAEILIEANASTNFNTSEGLGGFISYGCSLNGNIKTRDGEMVGGFNATASGIGVNDVDAKNNSLLNCLRKAYGNIKDSILNFYLEKKTVKLEIRNVKSINELNDILKYLRNIPSIRSTFMKNYEESLAVIDIVLYKGRAQDVVDYIRKINNIEIVSVKDFSIVSKIK